MDWPFGATERTAHLRLNPAILTKDLVLAELRLLDEVRHVGARLRMVRAEIGQLSGGQFLVSLMVGSLVGLQEVRAGRHLSLLELLLLLANAR